MSNQITTARVQGFKQGIDILSQQKGSKLQMCVRTEMQSSKQDHYDQISSTSAVQRTTRHGPTPLVETPHSRRAVTLTDWEWADLIDRQDRLRVLNDPANAYSTNAAYAMGRVKDTLIINAAFSSAKAGETGAAADDVAYDTNNDVGDNTIVGGLTLAMLIEAKEILGLNNTDDEETYIICNAGQISDLLIVEEVTSADYATVKALVAGEIDTFMGFKFIQVSTGVQRALVNGNRRELPFYRKSGMLLATGEGESGSTARISERDDRSYATQIYYSGSFGAVRMEEAKVGRIFVQEA